jgi:hypothetical protein
MAFKYKGLRLKDPSLMKKLRQVPLTFTRASVAYDYKGDAVGVNTPRFQHLINGVMEYGCLIEEAHTNILPASQSQSLSEAYTTAALNGTYTFQCEGTGSYELSGGATGTVSKDNPVTAAVSSATVTLTPTGTSTLNQVINKAYPLSYTLGGTTQAAEKLSLNSAVIKPDSLTVEAEVIPLTKTDGYILSTEEAWDTNRISLYYNSTSQNISVKTRDKDKNVTDVYVSSTFTRGTAYTIGFSLSPVIVTLYKNNTPGSPVSSPKIPSTLPSTLVIGQYVGGTGNWNGIIRNLTLSKIERGGGIIYRNNQKQGNNGYIIDKNVSLVAPLTRDLKAYRVRT